MSEYAYVDGTPRLGYYCANCGEAVAFYNSHFKRSASNYYPYGFSCTQNLKLIHQLRRANPLPGTKPHYVRHAVTQEVKE